MKHSTHLLKRTAGLALALVSAAMLVALLNYSLARFAPAVFAFEDDLRCGEPVTGTIASRNETDTFSFTAADGQRFQITVVKVSPSGANFQPEWRLVKNNGSPAAPCGSFTVNSQRDCGPLASSDNRYRIEIRDSGGNDIGAYRVHLYSLSAAPSCDDRPLECGTRSDASIDDPLDSDLFSFNAVANEPVSVTVVKAAQSGANFQTEWRLLSGNGAPVSGPCGNFSTSEQPTACGPLPVGANPYRVQVQDAGNNSQGDYSVTVNFRATACPPSTISLSPTPLTIVAGTSANLTVTINQARNAQTRIALASGTPAVALAPNEVTIPANATSASFPVRGVSVGGPVRVVATLPTELGGGTAQAIINVIAPTLSLTSCSPLRPGTTCTMTATLSHALDRDTTLGLGSSNTAIARVPATATILAGQRSVSFQVTGIAAGGPVTITATLPAALGGGTATALVTVSPPPFTISLSPTPLTIVAGTSENLRVTINQARNAQTRIALASGTPAVALAPNEVTIPANATSASFPVRGVSVGGPVRVVATLPTELGGGTAQAIINVIAPTLSLTSCSPLTPGTTCTMTATLSHALDENTQINLNSSHPGIAFVPLRATIPAGQRSVSFQVTGVSPGGPVTIRATLPAALGGDSATANVTVGPPPFTISLSPNLLNIIAGTSENMRVTINQARNQQTQIELASSNSNIASVPNSVTIPANATSAQFRVTGESVGGPVTITAKLPQQLGGGSDTSTVRVLAVTLSLSPCSEPLTPNTSCTMTATISHELDIHTELRLSSSDTSIARVPDTATIPAGRRTVSFEVFGVRTGGPVTIRATLPAKLGGDSATAQVTVGPLTATADIEIIPPNPTTNDNVSVKISGTFPNTCIPTNPQVSRSGNEITIATSNPGQICLQRLTPWSHTVSLGQLPAGTFLTIVTYDAPRVSLELGRKSFTVTGPINPRILRVVNTNANPNSSVRVPITLDSQGDENAIGFSLSFDTAILSNPQVALGSDATGALLTVNSSQVAQGRLGVLLALPAGQRFAAGVRQVAVVGFTVAATSATTTTITPVDQPIPIQASDVNANPLPISGVAGVVTISQGLEADVAPRTGGNGAVTIADCVQVGRFVAGLDTPSTGPGGEFQRADDAPRDTSGDGRLGITDWVQACRYAAALDPTQPAGGPTSPVTTVTIGPARKQVSDTSAEARTLRVINPATGGDGSAWLIVTLDAQGAENALGFSLRFDPTVWRFVSASAGGDTAEALININADQAALGRLGVTLSLPAGRAFAAGTREVIRAQFAPISHAAENSIAVAFGDLPVAGEAADVNANALPIRYAVSARELRAVTVVSAASFEQAPLAAESIATAFGGALSADAQAADVLPLPAELAGTRAIVRDSAGVDRPAPLFFVSPAQINYLVPEGTAAGDATLIVTRRDGSAATGAMRIAPVAPALFTANSTGDGVAAAVALRVRNDGSQSYEPVALFDPAQSRFVAAPIALGDDQVFLTLFGTGFRHRSSMAEVKAKIGGVDAEVIFAGAQGGYAGLDQINLRIPRNLIGRGEVEIVLIIDGQQTNPAQIHISQ